MSPHTQPESRDQWSATTIDEPAGLEVAPEISDKIYINYDKASPEVVREYVGKEVNWTQSGSVVTDQPGSVVAEKSSVKRWPWWRRKRAMAALAVILLVAIGAILGGVLGAKAARDGKVSGQQTDAKEPLPTATSTNDGDTGSNRAGSTPSSKPSASSTSALSKPTSINPRSMLSSASFRDSRNGKTTIFLAYQSPNDEFKIARYTKTAGKDDGTWHKPQAIALSSAPKQRSGIGIGLMNMKGGKSDVGSVGLSMNVFSSDSTLVHFDSEATQGDLEFGTSGGSEYTFIGAPASYSNMAMYTNFLVFQNYDGRLILREMGLSDKGAQQRDRDFGLDEDMEVNNATRLALLPLSANYTKTVTDGAVGIIYNWLYYNNLMSMVPGSKNGTPLKTFPSDLDMPRGSSFAAFSLAHSKSDDDDSVDVHVLFQTKPPDFRHAWTDDGGKIWSFLTPDALRGGDIGTSITCTSPLTIDDDGIGRLEGASDMTRCYFFKDGYLIEVQFDGVEWTVMGKVPLP